MLGPSGELPTDQRPPGHPLSSALPNPALVDPVRVRRTKRCRTCVAGEENNRKACNLKKVNVPHCCRHLLLTSIDTGIEANF
jgi:hypothetical protein